MSNFACDVCGATISDSPAGYVTGCEHYPVKRNPAPIAPVDLPPIGQKGRTPTERTLSYLRAKGYECGIVERRIQGKYISLDLFSIIDIIALTPGGVMGVQSTGQDFAGHLKKLTKTKVASSAKWLRTPGTSLMLIGWRKLKRGDRLYWEPRIKMIEPGDLWNGLQKLGRLELIGE